MPDCSTPLIVRDLGLQPYESVWEAMKAFTAERDRTAADELWCVQHPPVYTQGQAGKAEHILAPGDIPVVQVDRGGQVTYHGPGQLVIYLMIDLPRAGLGVRQLVDIIEQSLVAVLARHGIASAPRPDAPGVYVDGAKIASLGLRVRRGCSFHGLALNVDMDMEPFSRINPCGFSGLPMCQVRDFSATVALQELSEQLSDTLARALGYDDSNIHRPAVHETAS
ncbi:lipoyl(octanoyl) transferase LipB [Marinobacter bryozoorum]|jgi:lipoyl(octanoyl) transferase|uniref:lipoyl(octanoyl) transferase LipB n=1 Tax=Marinobacter bryozoorum TaxID=256324 RepID=UPI002005FA56|nr:lipoyl(octanoyl) transferase LipB [Marinobacter bryozoorum]MCK7543913.1 lipoyl(octanoyl) transferase LipB [Marinobacter bryozoorum]